MGLDETRRRFGSPKSFKSDQGSQFIGSEFISRLKDADVRIMVATTAADPTMCYRITVAQHQLKIYLQAYDCVADGKSGLSR